MSYADLMQYCIVFLNQSHFFFCSSYTSEMNCTLSDNVFISYFIETIVPRTSLIELLFPVVRPYQRWFQFSFPQFDGDTKICIFFTTLPNRKSKWSTSCGNLSYQLFRLSFCGSKHRMMCIGWSFSYLLASCCKRHKLLLMVF